MQVGHWPCVDVAGAVRALLNAGQVAKDACPRAVGNSLFGGASLHEFEGGLACHGSWVSKLLFKIVVCLVCVTCQ